MMQLYNIMEKKVENAILFEISTDTLKDMKLVEHIQRLEQMSQHLQGAVNQSKQHLNSMRRLTKEHSEAFKSSYHSLQNQMKQEIGRLKASFDPIILEERKKINQIKNDVCKVTTEALSIKKTILSLESLIQHCETEIGFKQLQQ